MRLPEVKASSPDGRILNKATGRAAVPADWTVKLVPVTLDVTRTWLRYVGALVEIETTLRQKGVGAGATELDAVDEIGVGVSDDGVGVIEESLTVDDATSEDDVGAGVEKLLLESDEDVATIAEEDDGVSRLLLLLVLSLLATCVDDNTSDDVEKLVVERRVLLLEESTVELGTEEPESPVEAAELDVVDGSSAVEDEENELELGVALELELSEEIVDDARLLLELELSEGVVDETRLLLGLELSTVLELELSEDVVGKASLLLELEAEELMSLFDGEGLIEVLEAEEMLDDEDRTELDRTEVEKVVDSLVDEDLLEETVLHCPNPFWQVWASQ